MGRLVDGPRINTVRSRPTRCWRVHGGLALVQQLVLDEAYVPFFGAFGAVWEDTMVTRRSATRLGALRPEMAAACATSGGGHGGAPAAAQGPGGGPGFQRLHRGCTSRGPCALAVGTSLKGVDPVAVVAGTPVRSMPQQCAEEALHRGTAR
jgi:hypothetical protein